MKILQVNVNIGSGSVGRIAVDLYNAIVESGNECKMAYGRICNYRDNESDIIRIGNLVGVCFHAVHSRIFDRVGLGACSYFETKDLLKKLDEFKPDIIHIHGCYGYYINIAEFYKYINEHNIQVINTLHSCWDFTGHCEHFTVAKCEKWKTGCFDCPEKQNYPSSYVFDNSRRNYFDKKRIFTSVKRQVFVCPSRWIGDLTRESFLKAYPVKVIPNGIDTNIFKPNKKDISKYEIDKNRIIILGVANNWTKRKGIDDFIDLSEIVDDRYQIVLVGNVPKKYNTKKIKVISHTENTEELSALYTAATVLFNPTYEDNYPTVNLEAIACGTPVITYDTGGSPESVKLFRAGEVVSKKDFARVLELANKYKNTRVNLSEELGYKISKQFMINEYMKLYNNLLVNQI